MFFRQRFTCEYSPPLLVCLHRLISFILVHRFPIGVMAFGQSFTGCLSFRIDSFLATRDPDYAAYFRKQPRLILDLRLLCMRNENFSCLFSHIESTSTLSLSTCTLLSCSNSPSALRHFELRPSSMTGTVGAIINDPLKFGSDVGSFAILAGGSNEICSCVLIRSCCL